MSPKDFCSPIYFTACLFSAVFSHCRPRLKHIFLTILLGKRMRSERIKMRAELKERSMVIRFCFRCFHVQDVQGETMILLPTSFYERLATYTSNVRP